MRPGVLGVETEYALTGFCQAGEAVAREGLAARLLDAVRARHPTLVDATGTGFFLANGARLYLDCGHHPELATPECADPWEAVRYVLAGHHILASAAAAVEAEGACRELFLGRCNVDYSGNGATWGSHESYLHHADPRSLARDLLPHLVSRPIYTGAGGFDPRSAGLEFTLSPRAAFLVQEVGRDSTSCRGILHSKDEALASGGTHRLHLICGESLCSEEAMLLRLGTTALVLAMAEAGLSPGSGVVLASSVEALRAFAADPSCRATARLAGGGTISALELQRHYLERAERALPSGRLPGWAAALCRRWRSMLDRLAQGPEAVATTLDWAIKLALYRRFAVPRCRWESLPIWSTVAASLRAAEVVPEAPPTALRVALESGGPLRAEVERLDPFLRQHGLEWSGLASFLRLRAELLEADSRFGQLGERGIFGQLDRQRRLDHRAVAPEQVEMAICRPPAHGRARLRGEWVRKLEGDPRGRYSCDWTGIWDRRERRLLDLSDPFAARAEWTATSTGEALLQGLESPRAQAEAAAARASGSW